MTEHKQRLEKIVTAIAAGMSLEYFKQNWGRGAENVVNPVRVHHLVEDAFIIAEEIIERIESE